MRLGRRAAPPPGAGRAPTRLVPTRTRTCPEDRGNRLREPCRVRSAWSRCRGRHGFERLGVVALVGHEARRQLMVDPAAPGAPQAANHQHLPLRGGEPPGPSATPDDDEGVVAHWALTHRRAPRIKVPGSPEWGSGGYSAILTTVLTRRPGECLEQAFIHPGRFSFPARWHRGQSTQQSPDRQRRQLWAIKGRLKHMPKWEAEPLSQIVVDGIHGAPPRVVLCRRIPGAAAQETAPIRPDHRWTRDRAGGRAESGRPRMSTTQRARAVPKGQAAQTGPPTRIMVSVRPRVHGVMHRAVASGKGRKGHWGCGRRAPDAQPVHNHAAPLTVLRPPPPELEAGLGAGCLRPGGRNVGVLGNQVKPTVHHDLGRGRRNGDEGDGIAVDMVLLQGAQVGSASR